MTESEMEAKQELRPLEQAYLEHVRQVMRHHLTGLTREELPAYLSHRLEHAGSTLPLLEPAAIEALFQATHGLPRKINRIAHSALSAAALGRSKQVHVEHLQAALDELQP
jgi:type II secretory pathway predicted ATPase ExeA